MKSTGHRHRQFGMLLNAPDTHDKQAVDAQVRDVKMLHLLLRNTGTHHRMQCSRPFPMYCAEFLTSI